MIAFAQRGVLSGNCWAPPPLATCVEHCVDAGAVLPDTMVFTRTPLAWLWMPPAYEAA